LSKWIVRKVDGKFDRYVDADDQADAVCAAEEAGVLYPFTVEELVRMTCQTKAQVVDVSTRSKGYVIVNAPNMEDMDLDVDDEDIEIGLGEYWIGVEGWGIDGEIEIGTIIQAKPWSEDMKWQEARELLATEWPKIKFVVEENDHAGGVQITGDIKMPIGRDPFRIRIDIDKNGKYRARLYMKVLINGIIEKRDVYDTTSKSPVIAAEGLCATLRAVYAFVDAAQFSDKEQAK